MCLRRKCFCVSNNPAHSVPLNDAASFWDWSTHLVKLPAPPLVADHRWRRTGASDCSVNLVIIDHHILTELKLWNLNLVVDKKIQVLSRREELDGDLLIQTFIVSRSFQVKGECRRLFQRWVQSQGTFLQISIENSWKEGTQLSN